MLYQDKYSILQSYKYELLVRCRSEVADDYFLGEVKYFVSKYCDVSKFSIYCIDTEEFSKVRVLYDALINYHTGLILNFYDKGNSHGGKRNGAGRGSIGIKKGMSLILEQDEWLLVQKMLDEQGVTLAHFVRECVRGNLIHYKNVKDSD